MAANTRFAQRVIVFVLILAALAFVINYGLEAGARHVTTGDMGKVNTIAEHKIDPAIAVFGSSVGEAGIDPRILQQRTSLSTYNFCIDGTRYMQYKGLIDEFAMHSKNNKYILFAESYFSFERVDAIHKMELYMAHLGNSNIYNALYEIQPGLVWKCRWVPFYKYITATDAYYKNVWAGWKNLQNDKAITDTLLGIYQDTEQLLQPKPVLWAAPYRPTIAPWIVT